MPTKWYLSRKWRACEKHFCALSIVFGPSGVHPIFGKAGSVVKIWLLQNGIAFWGIKVQIVPYHFVSKQIPCAHPFCRLFSMPPILCLEKAGSDPMGLISTGIYIYIYTSKMIYTCFAAQCFTCKTTCRLGTTVDLGSHDPTIPGVSFDEEWAKLEDPPCEVGKI